MKTNILLLMLCFCSISRLQAQVKIGDNPATITPNTLLELESTSKGMLTPRMTDLERQAINPAAEGMLVYQTNGVPGFYYYTDNAWTRMLPVTDYHKVVSGYIGPNTIFAKGLTVTRLANEQYIVSWPNGTFPGIAVPDVRTFSGSVSFSSFSSNGSGGGTFTTVTGAGTTIWFSISEVKY